MSRSSKKMGPAKRVQQLKEWLKANNLPKPRKKSKDEDEDILIDYSSFYNKRG